MSTECLVKLSTHCFFDCAELCQDSEAKKDDVAMNVLRLESLMDSDVGYLA